MVFMVKENFNHTAANTRHGFGLLVGIVRLRGKIVPCFGGYAVAEAEQVSLSGIEDPVVIAAQSEEGIIVGKFHLVVVLVALWSVGGSTAPFDASRQ